MDRKLSPELLHNQRLANLASYAILAAMMVCLSVTCTQLLKWVTRDLDGLQWDHLPFVALLVALEAIFTRPVARELEGRERWLYHFAEWVTFAVLLKGIYYVLHGFSNLPADLPRWQQNILTFFEGEYLLSIILVIAIWFVARATANDIEELNIAPTDLDWEFGKLQNSRSAVRDGLVGRLLWAGIVMILMAAGVRLNIAATLGPGAAQEPVLNIMIYFFLALLLFSLTHFAVLNGRWFWQQTPSAARLPQQWLRYGLLFFALLTIVSFILPTNYAMGLLETLNFLLNWLIAILIFVVQLIFLPILWLLSISGCTRQSVDQAPAPAPLPTPLSPPSPAAPIPWLELLQSVVFWGLFLLIITYSLIQFIRQNPQMAGIFKNIPILAWISSFWRGLMGWVKGASSQVAEMIAETRQRLFTPRKSSSNQLRQGWLNFGQLTPRQRIVFYYLRLLERSSQHGLARKPSETPHQYAQMLETNLPEVQEDIAGLTDTFLEARYSNHPLGDQQTSLVQRFWRNITRSLNHLHKPGPPSK